MGDIIEFPTIATRTKTKEEADYDTAMDSVDVALQIFDIIEDSLLEDGFVIDLTNPEFAEARDMYVITNLISSMIMRHRDVKHVMHSYLDDLYYILVNDIDPHGE